MVELREELGSPITITDSGRQTEISKQRAIIKSLVTKAIDGDMRAVGALLTLFNRAKSDIDEPDDPSPDAEEILDDYDRRQAQQRAARDENSES